MGLWRPWVHLLGRGYEYAPLRVVWTDRMPHLAMPGLSLTRMGMSYQADLIWIGCIAPGLLLGGNCVSRDF